MGWFFSAAAAATAAIPERQRARKARSQALQALHTLQTQGPLSEAALCDGVYRAVATYISDKLALEGAGLTVEDMLRYLQTHHLEPGLMAQAEAVLHLCDSARYAPGSLAVAPTTHRLARRRHRPGATFGGEQATVNATPSSGAVGLKPDLQYDIPGRSSFSPTFMPADNTAVHDRQRV